jgi:hypothetical protein
MLFAYEAKRPIGDYSHDRLLIRAAVQGDVSAGLRASLATKCQDVAPGRLTESVQFRMPLA